MPLFLFCKRGIQEKIPLFQRLAVHSGTLASPKAPSWQRSSKLGLESGTDGAIIKNSKTHKAPSFLFQREDRKRTDDKKLRTL